MPLDESLPHSTAGSPSTPAPTPTRQRRRWWSVSVRGLMLFVLIVGGSIGWEVNQVGRMRRAITVLQRPITGGPKNPWAGLAQNFRAEHPAGSEVEIAFDDEYSEGQYRNALRPAWMPHRLRRFLGEDHFRNVSLVTFHRRPTAEDWDALDALPTVQDLSFGYVTLAKGDLDRLATRPRPSLRELKLFDTKIDDQALGNVAGLRSLRELDLRMTSVTDAGLASLAKLDQLEVLFLSPPAGTDAGLKHLQGMRNLRVLDANGNRVGVTDVGLEYLRAMRRLETLEFNAHGVTNAGMTILKALPRLRSLKIQPVFRDREPMLKLSATGIQGLAEFTQLESLELGALDIVDDDWLKPIGGFSNLTHLRISGNGITDAGVAHLAKLNHLKELRISSPLVTDAGLAYLAPLIQLERLGFTAEISDAAVAAFQASHPGLKLDNTRWSDLMKSEPTPLAPFPNDLGLPPAPVAPAPPLKINRPSLLGPGLAP